jgi:hypothetical protein
MSTMNNGQYPPSTERRQRTVLKELSSPVTNEAIFIAAAAICAAIGGNDPGAWYARMLGCWMHDDTAAHVSEDAEVVKVAATRGQRRKEVSEEEFEKLLSAAKRVGII